MTAAAPQITRFAPSPTGRLHLGHAFSALVAFEAARVSGGTFLLRIEDTDQGRSRAVYEQAIYDDLHWLGLRWPTPVMRQSERGAAYAEAMGKLKAQGLTYPCFCTRKDIEAEFRASISAPHGPDGPLYPGTCRALSAAEANARMAAGESHAIRLNMSRALETLTAPLTFTEKGKPVTATPEIFGDVVLARKDALASYHLAVVVDDAAQGITLVTRGEDLLPSTHVHRLLQDLLGLPVPAYAHHELICDETGKRLAKRHDALSLEALKGKGETAESLKAKLPPLPISN